MKQLTYFLVLVLCIGGGALADGLDWKLSSEAGLSRTAIADRVSQDFLVLRMEGVFRLRRRSLTSPVEIRLRLQPELLKGDNSANSMAAQLRASYLRRHQRTQWGLSGLHDQQHLFFSGAHLIYRIFQVNSQFAWDWRPRTGLHGHATYAHRHVNSGSGASLQAVILQGGVHHTLSRVLRLETDLYAERFAVANGDRDVMMPEDDGLRFGPGISFNYRNNLLLQGNIRYLRYSTDAGSVDDEIWMRLVAGKILSDQWSVFVLFDYYQRSGAAADSGAITGILYAPQNAENRFFLKVERDISDRSTLFLRFGYTNEDVVQLDNSLSGWRGTAGVTLKR